ncbi:MAG: penicillin-binding protein activator LpoB [Kiritimatiellae bacterium]|nr:penicillin-binding protein activator LpoB [Kiritimatiellia bacterium]
MKQCLFGMILAALAAGCTTPTTRVDLRNDLGPQVAGLDYRDVQQAARESLQSLYKSGKLERGDNQMYVMTVGKVKNDTMQRFDTDILTSYITEELMNDNKVTVTSAMAASADNRDEMIQAVRSVRGNGEFNQNTVAKTGQLVAPTHSVYGKIIQREIRMDNGDKQIEYYFQLRIVELATGLQWWQKQVPIVKRTDGRTPTW